MLNYRPLHSGSVDRARQLRRDAPEPERRLLRAIREAFPEQKWRHQSPVGPYYVDILCLAERLAIEVDGDTHANSERYDAARTRFLESERLRVLRFANNDVMENVEGVLAQISLSLWEHQGNSAPRCSGHAGGMIDLMLEGAPEGRKSEGDQSPSPRAATRLAPLPKGEGL